MKCARCAAELPDSATLCYNCGLPVQKDKSNVFSYLPEGTPPWPTSTPTKAATTTTTPQALVTPPPVRRQRSTRSIVTIVALLVLTPIVGIGATLGVLFANGQFTTSAASPVSINTTSTTPTPRATATAGPQATVTAPQAFHQTSNTDLNISYQYPGDWQVDPEQKLSGSTTIVIHSGQNYAIAIYVERLTASASASYKTNNELNQANLQSLASQGYAIQETKPTQTTQLISGISWDEQDAIFFDQNTNATIRLQTITGKHGAEYYNIAVFIPDLYYKSALEQYIMPMLSKIKFIV